MVLIMLNYYEKIKSKLNLQPEEKLLIGDLANSANNPNLGYINVYFEVDEYEVKTVNPIDYIDSEVPSRAQVFVRGGYENFVKEYGYKNLLLFRASKTNQVGEKGSCIFTCVYSASSEVQHHKIQKDCPFVAEISQQEFSSELLERPVMEYTIEQADDDFFDTPHYFQIDTSSKKILGPLIRIDKETNVFHGPRDKVLYPFWNARSVTDYNTLISNYEGYEGHIAEVRVNGVARKFLINLDAYYQAEDGRPRNQDFRAIDLIPEKYLINEFYKSIEKVPSVKPFQKGKVKEWLANKSLKLDKTRKTRLYRTFSEYEDNKEQILDSVKKILESDAAEPLLKSIALENEDKYLERYREKENQQLERLKVEVNQKKREIEKQNDAVKVELSKSQHELTEINKKRNEIQILIDTKLQVALENIEETDEYKDRMIESTAALSEINKNIEAAKLSYGHYDQLIELDNKLEKLNDDYNHKKRIDFELNTAIEGLTSLAKASSADLAKAYINNEIINEIHNNDYSKYIDSDKKKAESSSINLIKEIESNSEYNTGDSSKDRDAVIRALTTRLEGMNRAVEKDKVEAAFIAIMQNQFVVFVGLPGSGKTSFAIQLTCALGATSSTLTIPVAKDWTRPKDLMGYYNPISRSYESGVTNFYPFYSSINSHEESVTTNSFLILDEFNLSQPEFYLSNLTGLADNSVSRTVNLGHETNVKIPETSRFICTANTDETVQSLSARMINRCAFIQFNDLHELEETILELSFNDSLDPLLTGQDMVKLFTATESDVISVSLKNDIDQLIFSFREQVEEYGTGISITPRKYKQLLQFCKVMSPQDNGESKVLDYAATFFLLPLISGSGPSFKNRLLNIKSIGEDLSLDDFTQNVSSIIDEGTSNFEYYRFIMA